MGLAPATCCRNKRSADPPAPATAAQPRRPPPPAARAAATPLIGYHGAMPAVPAAAAEEATPLQASRVQPGGGAAGLPTDSARHRPLAPAAAPPLGAPAPAATHCAVATPGSGVGSTSKVQPKAVRRVARDLSFTPAPIARPPQPGAPAGNGWCLVARRGGRGGRMCPAGVPGAGVGRLRLAPCQPPARGQAALLLQRSLTARPPLSAPARLPPRVPCRLAAPHCWLGLALQRCRAPGCQPAAADLGAAAAVQPAAGACACVWAELALLLLLLLPVARVEQLGLLCAALRQLRQQLGRSCKLAAAAAAPRLPCPLL